MEPFDNRPMYAKVLGWAANLLPQEDSPAGSFAEAVLEDVLYYSLYSVQLAETVFFKCRSKKRAGR